MDLENFTENELKCSCCGKPNPHPDWDDFMGRVQALRYQCDFPFIVSSAYRCKDHPIEAAKRQPGMHNKCAIDITVHGDKAVVLLTKALAMGFTGIGINQKGDKDARFIHLDRRPYPWMWSY